MTPRQEEIHRRLRQEGPVTIDSICSWFDCPPAYVRSTLSLMFEAGEIVRLAARDNAGAHFWAEGAP